MTGEIEKAVGRVIGERGDIVAARNPAFEEIESKLAFLVTDLEDTIGEVDVLIDEYKDATPHDDTLDSIRSSLWLAENGVDRAQEKFAEFVELASKSGS